MQAIVSEPGTADTDYAVFVRIYFRAETAFFVGVFAVYYQFNKIYVIRWGIRFTSADKVSILLLSGRHKH